MCHAAHRRRQALRAAGALLLLALAGATPAGAAEPRGMDPLVKDWIQVLAWIGGLVTVVVGLWKLRREVHDAAFQRREQAEARAEQARKELAESERLREQQERELRWRKASLARQALKEVLAQPLDRAAMKMLDWDVRDFQVKPGEVVTITRPEMLRALRVVETRFTEKEQYIRDCFDSLFGSMQMLRHYVEIGLLEADDLSFPFAYYARLLGRDRPVFELFLRTYDYDDTLDMLQLYDGWTSAAPASPAATPVPAGG